MVKFVENELLNIKTEVNDMWQLVYQQLDNAYKSVLNVDMELADKVILREKRVNAFELRIDSDIEDFIALYNPVAVDLRFALAMLKINTNLERIGDYADSIARFVIRTDLKPENKALFAELQLEDMFDMVLAGDHINNLAEETVFYIDAEVLKHHKSMMAAEEEANG